MPARRPNILLITSDQQHHSTLGAVNDRIKTPALDRLCREGVRFDRAYCPNPTCTPTRATLLTGMYPSQHGAWSLGTKLFEDVPVISDRFRAAGYFTSLVGKAHFQPLATEPGMESLECQPILRDLDFWRAFHGPWYGFEHVEVARMHGDESHAGQHYAIWMEERGLANWRDYFQPWPPAPEHPRCKRKLYWDAPTRTWELPEEYHYSKWTAERTIAQIERAASEGRPFFCWSSFHDPHPPYTVPEPWASMCNPDDMVPGELAPGEHDKNPIHFRMTQEADPKFQEMFFEDQGMHGAHSHLHDRAKLRRDMACYYGMTSFMDQEIGRILEAVDRLGMAEETLVVFTTDHGHFLGQHGLIAKAIHHYEDLLRLPFIVRWPGQVPSGRVSGAIQNLIDLPPTFLAAAGLEVPGIMTGVNQLGTWTGGEPARTWSITENRHTKTNFHMRTYVNERYKITVYRKFDDGELFDLWEDPGEIHNLWHEPAAAELKGRLLLAFMQATMACEPTRMPRIAGA
ncbi:MAG: sulfatase-like hydrolase/transferase [Phycisphaerae bacterium]|nr:sulfatase-like hydrolase/transferase [Phycisphaerae bacterium]